jgi:hypothetical protein
MRRRRADSLLAMIEDAHARHGRVRIIDIGGSDSYWNIVSRAYLRERGVEITIVNLRLPHTRADDPIFSFAAADGCDLSHYGDACFHIAHSNSVLEHVGDWSRMVQLAREIRRVAPHYFVQTPSYWFPIEPHSMTPCFHWLPLPVRVELVRRFALGHWPKAGSIDAAVRIVDSARLLSKGMVRELFPEASIATERVGPLPKSYIAVK